MARHTVRVVCARALIMAWGSALPAHTCSGTWCVLSRQPLTRLVTTYGEEQCRLGVRVWKARRLQQYTLLVHMGATADSIRFACPDKCAGSTVTRSTRIAILAKR